MIKVGDIVRSNGRIKTMQDGNQRYIEFEQALVLEATGQQITVTPVGRTAKLVAHLDDLHVAKAAEVQLQTAGELPISGAVGQSEAPAVPPEVIKRTRPKLSGLHSADKVVDEPGPPSAAKPTPKRRTPPARRRKRP